MGAKLRYGRQDLLCLHSTNEEMIREHARQGGFPANSISEIKSIIDPTTAEGATRNSQLASPAGAEASRQSTAEAG